MLFIIERGVCDACKLLDDREAQGSRAICNVSSGFRIGSFPIKTSLLPCGVRYDGNCPGLNCLGWAGGDYMPLGNCFSFLQKICLNKTQEDIKIMMFIKVLRGEKGRGRHTRDRVSNISWTDSIREVCAK